MASRKRRDIPEAEAEQRLAETIGVLDDQRVENLKTIADEQAWKTVVMRAELERLEPVLTRQHPRLVRILALIDHYEHARAAIEVMIDGKDDEEVPVPGKSWRMAGIVRSQRLQTTEGLKVMLESGEKGVKPLQSVCNADGFYELKLEPGETERYKGIPLTLNIYLKEKKPIFTLDEIIMIKPGEEQRDFDIG